MSGKKKSNLSLKKDSENLQLAAMKERSEDFYRFIASLLVDTIMTKSEDEYAELLKKLEAIQKSHDSDE